MTAMADAGGTAYLKAKFQIGSAAGRVDYEDSEHVFHTDDVPAKAKQARREVTALLKSNKLTKNYPSFSLTTYTGATNSGVKATPWDTGRFEDRLAHSADAKKRNKEVQLKKTQTIKNIDPDTRRFQPQWNNTISWEKNGRDGPAPNAKPLPGYRPLSQQKRAPKTRVVSTYTGETMFGTKAPKVRSLGAAETQKDRQPVFKQKLPASYNTCYQQELEHEAKFRVQKAKRREVEKQKQADDLMLSRLHGDDSTFPEHTLTLGRRSEASQQELSQTLAQTYSASAMEDYLGTLPASPQAMPASPKRSARNYRKAQRQGQGGRPGPQVVREYEHRGMWGYSAPDECEAWSCCMNYRKDSRGCTSAVVVDQRRWNTAH